MMRSIWKPVAISAVSIRKLKFLTKLIAKKTKKDFKALKRIILTKKYLRLRYFIKKHISGAKRISNCFTIKNRFKAVYSHNTLKVQNKNLFPKTILKLNNLRGRFPIVLRARPQDTIIRLFNHIRLFMKFKGGYKVHIKGKRAIKNPLSKFFSVNRYFSGRKFGEFIITRVTGGFRKNKDKAKIKKLKKDIEKAKRRRAHQVKEDTRIWKKVLDEAKKKGKGPKKGKVGKKK